MSVSLVLRPCPAFCRLQYSMYHTCLGSRINTCTSLVPRLSCVGLGTRLMAGYLDKQVESSKLTVEKLWLERTAEAIGLSKSQRSLLFGRPGRGLPSMATDSERPVKLMCVVQILWGREIKRTTHSFVCILSQILSGVGVVLSGVGMVKFTFESLLNVMDEGWNILQCLLHHQLHTGYPMVNHYPERDERYDSVTPTRMHTHTHPRTHLHPLVSHSDCFHQKHSHQNHFCHSSCVYENWS